jgi:ankyrin repeat protein
MKIDMQDIFCTTKDGLKWNESISLPKALLPYSSGIVQRTHHAASTDDDKPVVKSFAKQMGYDQEYRHVRAALYGGKLQGVPFTFAWAAQWQHTEVVNFLLREGIVKAHKCLADAIVADHYAVVAILLQSSVFRARYHIDWPIANSANALQIAVVCGRVKMVDLLVQAGANVNTRGVDFPHTNTAKTPFAANFVLKIATIRQSPELVANLLAKGAWVDAACAPYTIPGGRTALGAALLTRRLDIIALLRDAGADIQYESTGAADSQLELYELLRSAVKAGSEDLAQVLLDLGAYSHRPRTPEHFAREAKLPLLELAVRSRCTEIVRILLKHGINANYADGVVCTALVVAVRLGEYDMVVALLEHGAEVNSSAEWGSPLSAAIASGSVEMTRLLLKHGAQFKRRPPGVPPRTPLLNGDLPWHLDLMNGDHCFPLP